MEADNIRYYKEPISNDVTLVLKFEGTSMLDVYAVANERFRNRLHLLKNTLSNISIMCKDLDPCVLSYARMTLSPDPKKYKSKKFRRSFLYNIFLHSYYNCYAFATIDQYDLYDIPLSLVKRIGRTMLCKSMQLLVLHRLVRLTDIIVLEADGEGPSPSLRSSTSDEEIIDRRSLVEYYSRSFGFSPVERILDMSQPIYEYVPMKGQVNDIISYCSR